MNPYLHVCPLNIDSVKQKLMQCEIFICLSGRPIYFENRKEHSKSFKSIPIYSVCILTYGLCNNKPELLKRKILNESISLEMLFIVQFSPKHSHQIGRCQTKRYLVKMAGPVTKEMVSID